MEKISVIVPVYNVEPYLPRCIESILGQSYENWELILVDDGSPDGCPAICDRYARENEKIHVIHQKNGGLSAARNAGIDYVMANSSSRWLTFLDSDDWLHRDYLQRMLSAAEQYGVKMVFCDYVTVSRQVEDRDLGQAHPVCLNSEDVYISYYRHCISSCNQIAAVELYENVRFPLQKLHEDCFISHIPLFRAGRAAILDEQLYYYYSNCESITKSDWKPGRLDELEAHEVRLRYLQEQGYSRAEKQERRITILMIYEQAETLAEQGDSEYAPYLKKLREELRRKLKADRDLVPMDPETVWIYLMTWHTLPLWRLGKKLQHWYHRRKGTEVF